MACAATSVERNCSIFWIFCARSCEAVTSCCCKSDWLTTWLVSAIERAGKAETSSSATKARNIKSSAGNQNLGERHIYDAMADSTVSPAKAIWIAGSAILAITLLDVLYMPLQK